MKHRIVPMAIVLLELGATQAKAQTTPETTTETKPTQETATKKTERIEVTGSRIRRIDVETSAPVQVIDKKEIEQSGVTSLGDVFRKSASSSPTGNFSGASNFVVQGAASIDLLGLGGNRTLVLLNGKRLPTVGGLDSVNIDNIPIGIIDRVEILSGGASAVYGADAVGGVVNIITKKELIGSEISLFKTFTQHKGGDELEFTAAQGIPLGDSGSLILSAGYRARSPIDKRDRDLNYSFPERSRSISSSPAGTWSYQANDTNFDPIGNWTPSPNCPAENAAPIDPNAPDDLYCTGERDTVATELYPKKRDWYAALSGTYTLPSDWSISGLLTYSRSVSESDDGQFLPYGVDPITGQPPFFSRARALELGIIDPSVQGNFFQVYARMPEFPDRTYVNTYDTLAAGVYLDGNLGDWKSSAGLSFASSDSKREGKKIFNQDEMSGLLFNEGNDPIYTPLDPNRDFSLIENTMTDLTSELNNRSSSFDVFFSKDMWELPGGQFSLGFGGSVAAESFKLTPDDKDTQFSATGDPLYTGTFADRGDGSRSITSVYSEFLAPVVKDVNIEGALRFDHYSDFDSTLNFGLGFKASLLPFLGVRGRAASSFTAPTLSSLHQVGGGGYLSVTDQHWCDVQIAKGNPCPSNIHQIYVDAPGNKELEPEVGMNYIGGIILDPLPGFNIVSDYYWINLKDTFSSDELQEIVDAWYQQSGGAAGAGTILDNPVETDADGVVTKVGLPTKNLGRTEVRAVDTKASYTLTLGGARTSLDVQYFRMLSYKVKEAEDAPMRQQVGFFGVPGWRWNNKLTLALSDQDFTMQSRTIAPMHQDPQSANAFTLNSKAGVYTEYDFVYGVDLPWNGTLQLGVNNIFDTIGGKVDLNATGSEGVASSYIYSVVGRAYFARVTQRF
ncbi:TonB-dependent receptor plug domain-containing protein [Oligoflexus tunisiensis]|uniref:TonB-dependent receptor plug domain-containing protein n=1 Tax=Oligoflexus tunisiensis TaxID=708132 RepID=UPI000A794572|nr:TonB-dependent receptor plug domain-containing protein [Oligoflexus tunisiensis]